MNTKGNQTSHPAEMPQEVPGRIEQLVRPVIERAVLCCFCGKAWDYNGEKAPQSIIDFAFAHEKECEKNPYLTEIKELKLNLSTARHSLKMAAEKIYCMANTNEDYIAAKFYKRAAES